MAKAISVRAAALARIALIAAPSERRICGECVAKVVPSRGSE